MGYRRRLLWHVLSRVEPGAKASDIVKGVDVLKTIGWIMEAWKEVKASTIEKCFVKCGFSEDLFETIIVDDDDDDRFSELQSLINGVVSDYADYLEQDENAPTSVSAVDTTSSAWKEGSSQ